MNHPPESDWLTRDDVAEALKEVTENPASVTRVHNVIAAFADKTNWKIRPLWTPSDLKSIPIMTDWNGRRISRSGLLEFFDREDSAEVFTRFTNGNRVGPLILNYIRKVIEYERKSSRN